MTPERKDLIRMIVAFAVFIIVWATIFFIMQDWRTAP